MTTKHNKFWATPLGSLIKHFISIILTLWLIELQKGINLFSFDWDMWSQIITAGVVSCIPVVINWLNPAYKNYGK